MNTTLATPITITIIVTILTISMGIPVWHYATALLLSATWRHRHVSLFEPLDFSPTKRAATPTTIIHATD